MKIKIFFAITLLSISFFSFSQPTFQKTYWQQGDNTVMSLKQTSDKGFVILGTVDTSSGAPVSGAYNLYIIKTDSLGDTLWTKTYVGLYPTNNGADISEVTGGGYIITGNVQSFGAGNTDVLLIRTNSTGNILWAKTFGGSYADYGYSVIQALDGGFVITGDAESFPAPMAKLYLIKTDASGNILWSYTYGGSIASAELGHCVRQTLDKGFIISGGTDNFGAGNNDVYVVKTDSNGTMLWSKTYGGIANDYESSIQQTVDKGYIITGLTESFGAGNFDAWLIKIDSIGNTLWVKTYGTVGYENGNKVQEISNGDLVVVGVANNFIGEAFALKTNNIGDTLWTKSYKNSTAAITSSTGFQSQDKGFILGGNTSNGLGKAYLIKTDSIGNSSCNTYPTTIIVNSISVITTNPATQQASPPTIVGTFTIAAYSGCNVVTQCLPVGVESFNNQNYSLNVYPNPTTNTISLSFSGASNFQTTSIIIQNTLGQTVKKLAFTKNINVSDLAEGVYFLQITLTSGEVYKTKFVKQ